MLKLEFTALEQSLISSEAEAVEQFLKKSPKIIFNREMCVPGSCEVL